MWSRSWPRCGTRDGTIVTTNTFSRPHGEERRAATRLEHPKSAVADLGIRNFRSRVNPRSVATATAVAALVLREPRFARPPQDEGGSIHAPAMRRRSG